MNGNDVESAVLDIIANEQGVKRDTVTPETKLGGEYVVIISRTADHFGISPSKLPGFHGESSGGQLVEAVKKAKRVKN